MTSHTPTYDVPYRHSQLSSEAFHPAETPFGAPPSFGEHGGRLSNRPPSPPPQQQPYRGVSYTFDERPPAPSHAGMDPYAPPPLQGRHSAPTPSGQPANFTSMSPMPSFHHLSGSPRHLPVGPPRVSRPSSFQSNGSGGQSSPDMAMFAHLPLSRSPADSFTREHFSSHILPYMPGDSSSSAFTAAAVHSAASGSVDELAALLAASTVNGSGQPDPQALQTLVSALGRLQQTRAQAVSPDPIAASVFSSSSLALAALASHSGVLHEYFTSAPSANVVPGQATGHGPQRRQFDQLDHFDALSRATAWGGVADDQGHAGNDTRDAVP